MGTNLIIGFGEVGRGLEKIIKADVADISLPKPPREQYETIHICYPYFKNFVKETLKYQKLYKAKLVIIHSTVPLGTSKKCGAVHSPIRGVHPNLDKGVKTFVKYFGGKNAEKAAQIFSEKGVKTRVFKSSLTTEALKLWETTQYGWFIVLEKEIYKWCKKKGLNYEEVYRTANMDYNEGYRKLNREEVVRPFLNHKEGKIGGHCVIPNCRLLNSEIAKYVLAYNDGLKN